MRNMMDRAMHYMERDARRSYTLTELRRAADIAIRSQYRLAQQLLDSGMVVRDGGNYRIADYLVREVSK
jgi:DNA-binding IclR family transcriptional regulator